MEREQFFGSPSADGRWIAGGFTTRPAHDSVALWDARSGRLVWETLLPGQSQRLTAVDLDAATATVAAECLSATNTFQGTWDFLPHERRSVAAECSSGTTTFQTSVALFDLKTGRWRATVIPRSEDYVGVSPCFTNDKRLLLQTKIQLEWYDPRTGKFLDKRVSPQSRRGFLMSTQPCGRFRITEHTNTDPNFGINPQETSSGIEVISEKDGALRGVILKNHPDFKGYATHPATEVVALLLGEGERYGDRYRVQVYQAATQRLLMERTFADPRLVESLWFSRDGSLLYVDTLQPRSWHWRSGKVHHVRPKEVRTFGTFFLGEREVYHQYWDGAIRDARTDRLIVRLASR